MKNIIVYGSGCKNCVATADLLEKTARHLRIDINLIKETGLQAIMEAGVVTTPAISINGKLIHSGSVPDQTKVENLLEAI
jgi:small redox-active disulfide protein 2